MQKGTNMPAEVARKLTFLSLFIYYSFDISTTVLPPTHFPAPLLIYFDNFIHDYNDLFHPTTLPYHYPQGISSQHTMSSFLFFLKITHRIELVLLIFTWVLYLRTWVAYQRSPLKEK